MFEFTYFKIFRICLSYWCKHACISSYLLDWKCSKTDKHTTIRAHSHAQITYTCKCASLSQTRIFRCALLICKHGTLILITALVRVCLDQTGVLQMILKDTWVWSVWFLVNSIIIIRISSERAWRSLKENEAIFSKFFLRHIRKFAYLLTPPLLLMVEW